MGSVMLKSVHSFRLSWELLVDWASVQREKSFIEIVNSFVVNVNAEVHFKQSLKICGVSLKRKRFIGSRGIYNEKHRLPVSAIVRNER